MSRIALLAVALATATPAFGDPVDPANPDAREADQLASQEKTLLGDLRKLEVERELRSEEFRQADTRLKHIQIDVASATTRIAQLQQQDVAERPDLRARIVEIYKLGQGRDRPYP